MQIKFKKLMYVVVAGVALMPLGACVQTTDPHQGGLFGYDGSQADARIAQRESALNDERGVGVGLNEQRMNRLEIAKQKQANIFRMKKELSNLKSSLSRLEKSVIESKKLAGAKKAQQERIISDIQSLKDRAEIMQSRVEAPSCESELEAAKQKQKALEKEISVMMGL